MQSLYSILCVISDEENSHKIFLTYVKKITYLKTGINEIYKATMCIFVCVHAQRVIKFFE